MRNANPIFEFMGMQIPSCVWLSFKPGYLHPLNYLLYALSLRIACCTDSFYRKFLYISIFSWKKWYTAWHNVSKRRGIFNNKKISMSVLSNQEFKRTFPWGWNQQPNTTSYFPPSNIYLYFQNQTWVCIQNVKNIKCIYYVSVPSLFFYNVNIMFICDEDIFGRCIMTGPRERQKYI